MAKKKVSHNDTIFQDTTEKTALPIKWSSYLDLISFRQKPINPAFIEKLAAEEVAWALNTEDAIVFEEFLMLKGIGQSTFYKWLHAHECLANAHNFAMMVIGVRREKGAINRKYDGTIILKSLPIYSESWKKIEEWRSKLTKDENADTGTKIVVIEKIANSEQVPERKGKNVEEASEVDTKG
jgi:hypothetical protein